MKPENDYQCVIVPPKSKRLRSRTVKLICEGITVDGFTRDDNGNDVPNGISFFIPKKVVAIKK